MKGTSLAVANDIAFAIVFAIGRIVLGPFLTYATVMSPTSHIVVKVCCWSPGTPVSHLLHDRLARLPSRASACCGFGRSCRHDDINDISAINKRVTGGPSHCHQENSLGQYRCYNHHALSSTRHVRL